MNSKTVGDISVAKILSYLVSKHYTVLIPFGDNNRYDLVIEDGGKFIRIQCKTAWLKDNVIMFNACSNNSFTSKKRRYDGEIDYFYIYSPDTDKIYCMKIDDIKTNIPSLRLLPPKNNQIKGIKFASDYEVK